MPSSLEIAQAATLRPIGDIADELGLLHDEVEPYGRYKAKVDLSVIDRLADRPDAKLINVTAITPTPAGEGKTTTSVSLTQGLGKLGRKPVLCLREASLGPVFGVKGGAAGGGYAQVVPMEDLNLHFTGDLHAITAANNLLAALIDAHLHHGNASGLDPLAISWRRCMDMNDRNLRNVMTGLGGRAHGAPRETGFDITAASEIMGLVAVARDLADLRERLGRITVGQTFEGEPVTAEQIGRPARWPSCSRTRSSRTSCRRSRGSRRSSTAARSRTSRTATTRSWPTASALKLGEYVITESGFASDMGMEKFFDITCRIGDLRPERGRARREHQSAEAPCGAARRRPRRDRDRRAEPRAPHRDHQRVRPAGRRRRQQVPDRTRRRSSSSTRKLALEARRVRGGDQHRVRERRSGGHRARRGRRRGRRRAEHASTSPTRSTRRSRRRSASSRRGSTARTAWSCSPPAKKKATEWAGSDLARAARSAWRRRTSRSRTIRR